MYHTNNFFLSWKQCVLSGGHIKFIDIHKVPLFNSTFITHHQCPVVWRDNRILPILDFQPLGLPNVNFKWWGCHVTTNAWQSPCGAPDFRSSFASLPYCMALSLATSTSFLKKKKKIEVAQLVIMNKSIIELWTTITLCVWHVVIECSKNLFLLMYLLYLPSKSGWE